MSVWVWTLVMLIVLAGLWTGILVLHKRRGQISQAVLCGFLAGAALLGALAVGLSPLVEG